MTRNNSRSLFAKVELRRSLIQVSLKMKSGENVIYTQKTLAQRYGISITALQYWYRFAGIVKPKKRGGYFSLDAVQVAVIFYEETNSYKTLMG